MIPWLWDAGASRCGVAGSEADARREAGRVLRSGEADVARVESARFALGGGGLDTVHERTGTGARATLDGRGRVRWVPLAAGLPAGDAGRGTAARLP